MLTKATRLSTPPRPSVSLGRGRRNIVRPREPIMPGCFSRRPRAVVFLRSSVACRAPARHLHDAVPRPSARGWVDVARRARILHGWGLSSVSFYVLLAGTAMGAEEDARGPTPGSAALAALVEMSVGAMSEACRLLAQDCSRLASAGLRGVETHARALLAQTAARIGDLGSATAEAAAADGLAGMTGQPAGPGTLPGPGDVRVDARRDRCGA